MRTQTVAVALILAAGFGCSDGAVAIDAATIFDAGPPRIDARVPDSEACGAVPVAPEPGAPCSADAECGTNGVCLREDRLWPTAGYCVHICSNNEDCGAGLCSPNPLSGFHVCMARCCGTFACERPGMLCVDTFMDNDIGAFACVPGTADARDGDPCESFGDCNRRSICDRNLFNNPGGYCRTFECTVGDDATCAPGGDGTCRLGTPPFPAQCFDQCESDADCREAEGYSCSASANDEPDAGPDEPDAGPPPPSVCHYIPPASPGAACTVDSDCGPPPWECLTGPEFPGGYCGASTCDPMSPDFSACPHGSTCWGPPPGSEFCLASCAGCRTDEGYACINVADTVFGCVYTGE